MIIRSKAPLRLSFAGGGTDVLPYAAEQGGLVLSATIDKYAYGTLRPRPDRHIQVQSLDYDIVAKYAMDEALIYDGELDLVKAVLHEMALEEPVAAGVPVGLALAPGQGLGLANGNGPRNGNGKAHAKGSGHANGVAKPLQSGLDFFLHSDAPPGSGLGSSSTMVVALIGLLLHYQRRPMTDYEVAGLAYRIERERLGIAGGMQDQYAATFGGFNLIEFGAGTAVVNPLRVDPDILNELHYHLLLCYTGRTRLSANIIRTQVENYIERKPDVMSAMAELKRITIDMKNALLQGRLDDFGALLHEGWLNKQRMAAQITTSTIDTLYARAREEGAIGGKITGAGGGGYLLLYCQFDKKHAVARALEQLGGQVVEFAFEQAGLQTWEVRG